MSLTRDKQIYISGTLRRRLFWLRQLENEKAGAVIPIKHVMDVPRMITIDEIAEKLLNEKIMQDYPNIAILERRLDALEGQLLLELLSPSEK